MIFGLAENRVVLPAACVVGSAGNNDHLVGLSEQDTRPHEIAPVGATIGTAGIDSYITIVRDDLTSCHPFGPCLICLPQAGGRHYLDPTSREPLHRSSLTAQRDRYDGGFRKLDCWLPPPTGRLGPVTDDQKAEFVRQLVNAPVHDFLDVAREVLAKRSEENSSRYVSTRYALAVVNTVHDLPVECDEGPMLEVLATPVEMRHRLPDLSEQGTCPDCGFDAIAEAKLARCGICEASLGLT